MVASILGTNSEGLDLMRVKLANAFFVAGIIFCLLLSIGGGAFTVLGLLGALGLGYARHKIIVKWKKQ